MKSRGLAFAIALSIAHAALWWIGIHREGSWEQLAPVDQAGDLGSAFRFAHAIRDEGLRGFLWMWVHHNSIHTPFVPAVSGLLMAVFGETRPIAESVLPLFTFVLVLSTVRVAERLYGAKTAFAAAALTTSFPLFLIFSRTYHFEHPLAAMVALAAWTMLRTEGFTRTGPSIVFGLVAGLASLTRLGAPVFLVGPTLVAAVAALRVPPRGRRLANLALATAIGAALAATWYAPNYAAYSTYLYRGTYGAEASKWSGAPSAFSWVNFEYYVRWNVVQGPGVPMAAVALLAFAVAGIATRGRALRSPTMGALGAVYAIDFLLLLAAAQREGARYFQPLEPIVAIAIVRAVAVLPSLAWRRVLGVAVAACALHHVVALTVAFEVPQRAGTGNGPFPELPLWDHTPYLLGVCEFARLPDPRADYRAPEIVERLEAAGVADGAVVRVIGGNELLNANALELEALRRRRRFEFAQSFGIPSAVRTLALERAREDLDGAAALVMRSGGTSGVAEEGADDAVALAFDPVWRPFVRAGDPLALGDGSTARIYVRRADGEILAAPPPSLVEASAVFGGRGSLWTLVAAGFDEQQPNRLVTLCFRFDEPPRRMPGLFVQLLDGEQMLAAQELGPISLDRMPRAAEGPWYVVRRVRIDGWLGGAVLSHGYSLRLGLIDPPSRLGVQSDLPVDDDGTRLRVWSVPPAADTATRGAGGPPAPGPPASAPHASGARR